MARLEGRSHAFFTSASASAAASAAIDAYGLEQMCIFLQVSATAGTGVGIQFFAEGSWDNTSWALLKDRFGTDASTAMLTASHATSTAAIVQLETFPQYVRVRTGYQSAGSGSYATFNVYGYSKDGIGGV